MKNVNHRIQCFSFSCLFWKTVGLETMKRTVTTITNYVGKLCIYSHVLKCSNSGDSEKATKYCEISTVDFSYVMPVKFMVVISQNFVAFSEYTNFKSSLIDVAFRDLKRSRTYKQSWPQSRESREIIGETETRKMDPRRDQSRGLESRLQALVLT